MTSIASLRHRLTLEAPEETPDGAGGVVRTWTSLGELWAAIEPMSASEAMIADRRAARVTHRVVLRQRSGLTLNHRFRLGQRTFAMQAIRDPDERGRFIECLVAEERP
ncbi:MAG: phage head closure protein [Bradyrhizobiaceae bacterium]|nr:phage head closure protein [Bradyrhizobiaceae bacterium]